MTTSHPDIGRFREALELEGISTERRSGRRYSLQLSCRVCPLSQASAELAGFVINISRSGMLVGLDSRRVPWILRPKAVVRVVLDLPRNPLYSPRCWECTARVVRIVPAGAQTQVAFTVGRMQAKEKNTNAISTSDWLRSPIEGLIQ